jgi:hypothetical protein
MVEAQISKENGVREREGSVVVVVVQLVFLSILYSEPNTLSLLRES